MQLSICAILLFFLICFVGCADSGSEPPDVMPASTTQEELGEASGSPDEMFLDDSSDGEEAGSFTE